MTGKLLSVSVLVLSLGWAVPAMSQQAGPIAEPGPRYNGEQPTPDPLAPFNERVFWFNQKLDEYVGRPVARGWAALVPEKPRQSVGHFFDNIHVIPRFANNLFQLKFGGASREVSRFAINTTLGLAGLFDVADSWFGIKPAYEDFGLTMGYYGIDSGPYLMIPFLGPSTIRDAIGRVADGFMDPTAYVLSTVEVIAIDVGTRAADAVNYESLNLQNFEDVDRFSVDLYGAIQDAYLERRKHQLKQ